MAAPKVESIMATIQKKRNNPSRAIAAKDKSFSLIDNFAAGYRNREDITKLPPGILIPGSQNVLTDVFNRVGVTKGYTLDGQSANRSYLLWEDEDAGLGFLLLESTGKIILTL